MKEIIKDKLNKISDLEERKLLKKILLEVYEGIIDYNMEMYEQLQRRVYDEISDPLEKYYIYSSLIHAYELDPISNFFHPMDPSDEEKLHMLYDTEEIKGKLHANSECVLTAIFLKCSHLKFEEIMSHKRVFQGVVKTNQNVHEIKAILKPTVKYIKIIETLYHIFQLNQAEWKTLHCPYAYKFADVVLDSPLDLQEEEQILEIFIDLEEYDCYKLMNMIPVWNVKEICLQDKSFPMPAQDKTHYEHQLDITKAGKENGYLLTYHQEAYEYMKRYEDTIVVVTFSDKQSEWNLTQIEYRDKANGTKTEFEILSNYRRLGFTGKFASIKSMVIRTRGELARVLQMYDCREDLQLYDIEILPQYRKQRQTINYNCFMEDNIRLDKDKKVFVLKFKSMGQEDFLIYDKMSFLVSEIQLLFPEYQCVGELVE